MARPGGRRGAGVPVVHAGRAVHRHRRAGEVPHAVAGHHRVRVASRAPPRQPVRGRVRAVVDPGGGGHVHLPAEVPAQPARARLLRRDRPLDPVRAAPADRRPVPRQPRGPRAALVPGAPHLDRGPAPPHRPEHLARGHRAHRGAPRGQHDRRVHPGATAHALAGGGGPGCPAVVHRPGRHVLQRPVRLPVAGHRGLRLGHGHRGRGTGGNRSPPMGVDRAGRVPGHRRGGHPPPHQLRDGRDARGLHRRCAGPAQAGARGLAARRRAPRGLGARERAVDVDPRWQPGGAVDRRLPLAVSAGRLRPALGSHHRQRGSTHLLRSQRPAGLGAVGCVARARSR